MKKNLSVICVLFFIFIALSSSRWRGPGSYYRDDKVEDNSDTRNYYVKNSGEKVFCGKVEYNSRMLRKDVVEVDGQELNTSEVLGYRFQDKYFGRINGRYVRRIIHGKINIYFVDVNTSNSSYTAYYSQVGEKAPLVQIFQVEDLLNLVNGCKISTDMINKKARELKRALKEDPKYFNKIFEIYNNGCKREKIIN
ncbi:MAG: hypothetical protein ACKVQV_05275 [Bacteroidia bacterium]